MAMETSYRVSMKRILRSLQSINAIKLLIGADLGFCKCCLPETEHQRTTRGIYINSIKFYMQRHKAVAMTS